MSDKIFRILINKKDYPVKGEVNCVDLVEFNIDYILSVNCGRTFEVLQYSYNTKDKVLNVLRGADDILIEYTSHIEYRDNKIQKILRDDNK